jgi:hypothetical protein
MRVDIFRPPADDFADLGKIQGHSFRGIPMIHTTIRTLHTQCFLEPLLHSKLGIVTFWRALSGLRQVFKTTEHRDVAWVQFYGYEKEIHL